VGGLAFMLLPMSADSTGMILYICTLMFLNTGNCIFQVAVWAIVADCIEVSYRKTGKAEEGSLYALYSFFRKLSQGIGQAVVSVGLTAIGFVEGENAVQPENFGSDVKNLYILVLVIGSFLTFASMQFIYNISKKDEEAMAVSTAEVAEISTGKGLDD
jgi:GPH family glycoside/pentoside/hexuronide:cation symporter